MVQSLIWVLSVILIFACVASVDACNSGNAGAGSFWGRNRQPVPNNGNQSLSGSR